MISISFFALLLATYCYSVPIDPKLPITTPDIVVTTGKTIVEHVNRINTHLVSDEESTNIPNLPIHSENSIDSGFGRKVTNEFEASNNRVSLGEGMLFLSSTMKPMFEPHSSEETDVHKHLNKFHTTTMETKHNFETRAIKPEKIESSEELSLSSSTMKPMSEHHSSEETDIHKHLNKFHTTTMETKHSFETRAIKPEKIESSEELSFSSSTMKPMFEPHSSEETDIHKDLNKFHTTTMETKHHFETRAIKPEKIESSEELAFSSSTMKPMSEHHSSEETDIHKNLNKFFTTTMETKHSFETRAIKPEKTESSEESLFSSSTMKPMSEHHSSEETDVHKNLNKFHTTTMETKHRFEIKSDEMKSSEEKPTHSKYTVPESSVEATTDASHSFPSTTSKTMGIDRSRENSHEQTASAEKFGTTTGLLKNKPKEVSSEDRSNVMTPQRMMIKNPTTIKTEGIIPVEIVETEILVEGQPVIEKKKPDN